MTVENILLVIGTDSKTGNFFCGEISIGKFITESNVVLKKESEKEFELEEYIAKLYKGFAKGAEG